MIPVFPRFKKLEISDKAEVESFTSTVPPYSDFSFASMWLWNHKDETVLSNLNGNLVVRLTDSRTGESFYSFLGKSSCNETASELLDHLGRNALSPELKLVPAVSAEELNTNEFRVTEDRDNFDYILCTKKLSLMAGSPYGSHRRQMRGFSKVDSELRPLDLTLRANQHKIVDCAESWTNAKNNDGKIKDAWEEHCFKAEGVSFSRTFESPEILASLVCFGLFIDGVLAGFSIGEMAQGHFCVHFEKTNYKHKGTTEYLTQQIARKSLDMGITHINWQEDLGLPGLRLNKSRYKPVHFLKKYTVGAINHL